MARHCKVCGFRCILSGTVFRYLICVAAVAIVAIGAVLCGRTTSAAEGGRVMETLPMTTQEHLRRATWWPTKQLASQEKFVGSAACARCHADFAATQGTSQMAHTLMPAARAEALQKHLSSEYHAGPYTYSLRGSGSGVDARIDMRVGDGKQARSAGLQWAFGSGEVGQSYLWQKDGGYRETRFNYFETLDGFDGTPGRMRGAPLSIDMAVGRTVEPFEAKTCFACHTTNMSGGYEDDCAWGGMRGVPRPGRGPRCGDGGAEGRGWWSARGRPGRDDVAGDEDSESARSVAGAPGGFVRIVPQHAVGCAGDGCGGIADGAFSRISAGEEQVLGAGGGRPHYLHGVPRPACAAGEKCGGV